MADSFAIRGRHPIGADNGRFRALLPIVVRFDQITVAVAQLQRRICQYAGDAELSKAWPERTNYHGLWLCSPDNNPSNQNGVAGPDLSPRGNIAKAASSKCADHKLQRARLRWWRVVARRKTISQSRCNSRG